MSREVVLIGVGVHPFGKFPGKSFQQLGVEACRAALSDAGAEWTDMQGLVAGIDLWSGIPGEHSGNELTQALGGTGVPVINVTIGCSAGSGALATLFSMISAGMMDIGMAVGTSASPKGYLPTVKPAIESSRDIDNVRFAMVGMPNPAYWALDAVRRMEEFGTTELHFAKIRAKNSRHGALNRYARYQQVMSVEDVMLSPYVCYPLRLFEICATSDGAAAVIACTQEMAKKYTTKPITVAGWSLASRKFGDATIVAPPHVATTSIEGTSTMAEVGIAAKAALKMAGIGPEDIDLMEIPDNTSYHELAYLEKVGVCRDGEADRLVEEGQTEIGGKIPVSPSGGFLSFGESVPAMGLLQAAELVWQLRGEAGARQVRNAKVGYAHTLGIYQNSGAIVLKK